MNTVIKNNKRVHLMVVLFPMGVVVVVVVVVDVVVVIVVVVVVVVCLSTHQYG